MIDLPDPIAELEAAGRSPEEELDIGTVALALAAVAYPKARRRPYRRHLEKLSAEVEAYVAGHRGPVPLPLRHEALVQVIHKRYGYVGTEDCFDDIEAANLMRVIDRRGGLPVAPRARRRRRLARSVRPRQYTTRQVCRSGRYRTAKRRGNGRRLHRAATW